MQPGKDFLWQRLPAFRILLPFSCGILLQYYQPIPATDLVTIAIAAAVLLISLEGFSLLAKFRYRIYPGICISALFAATGALAIHAGNYKQKPDWIGKKNYDAVLAVISEPVVEKPNSFHAVAALRFLSYSGKTTTASGKTFLSFPKSIHPPAYGQEIIIWKKLSEIKSNANPGGFDYKTYCDRNGTGHQVYLTEKDFRVTGRSERKRFYGMLFEWRGFIIRILQTYLSDPKLQGLAEALLIGYKEDLDKDLVTAYANTGVVHVIAISGLHLALVYGLLMLITRPLSAKRLRWLRMTMVVCGLWIFSLLAGAQPSILRAAVMFTLIAMRMMVNRNGSVYNSISFAAFILLAWNPYWLWDPGFQLSFLAVFSIILFYKRFYNLLYFPNKAIDFIWQLAAASLAAQVFTFPVIVYYFHQFPFLFLITNIVAVPLSSLIVYIEIFLCCISPLSSLATITGKLLEALIRFMNSFVERMNSIPYANWTGLSISLPQLVLLYVVAGTTANAIINRRKMHYYLSMFCLLAIIALRSCDLYKANNRRQVVVYNIPKKKVIDYYNGRQVFTAGDRLTGKEKNLISPSRILYRASHETSLPSKAFICKGRSVVVLDASVNLIDVQRPINLLIISGRGFISISDIIKNHSISQVVIAADVPASKAAIIQKTCELYKISCYSIVDKGAFVMDFE